MAITLSEAALNDLVAHHTANTPVGAHSVGICIYRHLIQGGSEYYAIFSYLDDLGMTYLNTRNVYDLTNMATNLPATGVKQLTTNGDFPMQNANLIVVYFPLSVISGLMPAGGVVSFDDADVTLFVNNRQVLSPSLIASGNGTSSTGRPFPPPWD